uniref:Putative 24 kDa family member n=1 Tax=Rhipicephalus pulchellus TaxID=72859 RepID=L7M9G9_RHIPC
MASYGSPLPALVATAAFVLGCLVVPGSSQFADCSASRAQQCETVLLAQQVNDASRATVPELLTRCRYIRQNLNCLLNYTALCLPLEQKEEKSQVIVSARKYAYATCEDRDAVKEHWKDGACFQKPEVQRCINDYDAHMKKYQLNSKYPSEEQCRRYMDYQRCMRRATSLVCNKEGIEFLGLFLYDREPTLSWMCSDDYRQPLRIEAAPTPAINQATCTSLVSRDLQRCTDRHQKATAGLSYRKQSSTRKSTGLQLSDEEHKTRLCCAFGEFAHCVRTAVQVKCSTDRNALVESIVQQALEFVGNHCDNYYYGSSLCSTAISLTSTQAVMLFLALVSACFAVQH